MRLWISDGVDTVAASENVVEGAGRTLILISFGIAFTVLSTMSFFASAACFALFLIIGGWKLLKRLTGREAVEDGGEHEV